MDVKWLVKLISEELSLLLLFEKLLLEKKDFTAKIGDASCFILRDNEEALELRNLILNSEDLLNSLLVIDLTLVKS